MEEGELAEIKEIGRQMAERCKRGDLNSYFKLNVELHQLLSNVSSNQKLHQVMNDLGMQTYGFRYTSLSLPGRMEKPNR